MHEEHECGKVYGYHYDEGYHGDEDEVGSNCHHSYDDQVLPSDVEIFVYMGKLLAGWSRGGRITHNI